MINTFSPANWQRLLLALLFSSLFVACAGHTEPSAQYMDGAGHVLGAATGKTHNPTIQQVIWQADFSSVLLVAREENSAVNQHPQVVTDTRLRAALASLRVRFSKDADPEPIFNTAELNQYVPRLKLALSQANPEQDVMIFMPQERGLIPLLKEKLMTSMRIFYQNGRLNIVFGELQREYEGQLRATSILRNFATPTRNQSNLEKHWLIPTSHVLAYQDKNRTDWVLLDLTPETGALQNDSALERLQAAENLKQKGLLTEEEYQKKRKEILERF
jgi:hypothetical protein